MAGTTTKSRRTQRPGSDTNDLLINWNKSQVDDTNRTIMSPVPVIKAGSSALAKTGATTTTLWLGGVYYAIAASTDFPALTGLVITAASFNCVVFTTIDGSTLVANFGTEGTTAATVVWPTISGNAVALAALMITHSSTFTGGTTALDTATTVYMGIVGKYFGTITAAKIGNLAGTVITATAG